MITSETSILDAAVAYAEMGFRPIKLHGIRPDGTCDCREMGCGKPGKHPDMGQQWERKTTSDVEKVRRMFKGHTGNIGLHMCLEFIALDADGPEGIATLESLGLPPTLTARTGGGGRHAVFRLAPYQHGELRDGTKLLPGLDWKTKGQIVVAPSLHVSGNYYEWTSWIDVAPLPDDVFDILAAAQSPKAKVLELPPRSAPTSNAVTRARAYAAKVDPGVQGQGGSNPMFRLACRVLDYGVSDTEAMEILREYGARCDPPWTSEKQLRHKLDDAHKEPRRPIEDRPLTPRGRVPMTTDGTAPRPDITPEADWRNQLAIEVTGTKKKVRKIPGNVRVYLQGHPEWAGRVRWDEFAERIVLREGDEFKPWDDVDTARLREWLARAEYPLEMGKPDVDEGVMLTAKADRFSPPREWMTSLRGKWDGTNRLASAPARYFGCEDTPYTRLVFRWWLISAVARVFKPGRQVDYMIVLEGHQGIKKSTALQILASPEWFSQRTLKIGSNDALRALRGKLIYEWQEMAGLLGKDADEVKSFLTNATPGLTEKYKSYEQNQPLQCVFAGTINRPQWMVDRTGNRRFWPLACKRADLEALKRDRDQLWAEAVAAYDAKERFWPETDAENALCMEEQERRLPEMPWVEKLRAFLEGQDEAYSEDCWVRLQVDVRDRPKLTQQFSEAMHELGFVYKVAKRHGKAVRIWLRTQ